MTDFGGYFNKCGNAMQTIASNSSVVKPDNPSTTYQDAISKSGIDKSLGVSTDFCSDVGNFCSSKYTQVDSGGLYGITQTCQTVPSGKPNVTVNYINKDGQAIGATCNRKLGNNTDNIVRTLGYNLDINNVDQMGNGC